MEKSSNNQAYKIINKELSSHNLQPKVENVPSEVSTTDSPCD